MQAHRHDQYFQMHFLDTGQIELQLDDHRYSVQAPLFVLTPPSVPHAFITESDSDGHVLTVREDLIWPLLEVLYPGTREAFGLPGICLSLADRPDELAALKHYWQLIARESTEQLPGANIRWSCWRRRCLPCCCATRSSTTTLQAACAAS
jgi:AraC family 4-hydroxyphenylacetate 3-monooxygenase operon regulatory protein